MLQRLDVVAPRVERTGSHRLRALVDIESSLLATEASAHRVRRDQQRRGCRKKFARRAEGSEGEAVPALGALRLENLCDSRVALALGIIEWRAACVQRVQRALGERMRGGVSSSTKKDYHMSKGIHAAVALVSDGGCTPSVELRGLRTQLSQ